MQSICYHSSAAFLSFHPIFEQMHCKLIHTYLNIHFRYICITGTLKVKLYINNVNNNANIRAYSPFAISFSINLSTASFGLLLNMNK